MWGVPSFPKREHVRAVMLLQKKALQKKALQKKALDFCLANQSCDRRQGRFNRSVEPGELNFKTNGNELKTERVMVPMY